MDTFGWPISDIHEDNRLVSYIFVNGLPESRLFKITFPESRFVKSPNPVSRSKLQSRISLPFSYKIPNPGLQISQIPDPEKPIGDPHEVRAFHRVEQITAEINRKKKLLHRKIRQLRSPLGNNRNVVNGIT